MVSVASTGKSSEHGVVLPFLVTVLFVLVVICFMSVQYVLNVEKQVRENKTVVAMIQLMQSATDAQAAFESGAMIARLQGLGDVLPQDAPQQVPTTQVDLDFDQSIRPPVAKVSLASKYDLLGSFGQVLNPQLHSIELSGTSDLAVVLSSFDTSYSMHGPDRGDALDKLLDAFGIPKDPQRNNPNPAARSLCSPIDTNDMWECRRYASRLPGYSLGGSAIPKNDEVLALGVNFYQSGNHATPWLYPPDGLPPAGSGGISKLICRGAETDVNEPGYRVALPGIDPTALPGTPQRWGEAPNCFRNTPSGTPQYCSDITDRLQCVTPWRWVVSDDPMQGFFTNYEYNVCAARWGGASPSPEIFSSGCGTQVGYLMHAYSDFWRSYKTVVQWFAIEVDRFAVQMFGVISAATSGGNFRVGSENANGHFVLWDGTGGYDPAHRGLGLMTADYLNHPDPQNARNETYVIRRIGGTAVSKNIAYNPAPVRRLLMRQAHDTSYHWFRPDPAAYQAIRAPANGLSPVPHWGVPPNEYGQYNSYGLSAYGNYFHPTRALNSIFSWLPWGDTWATPESLADTFFPVPHEANFHEGFPLAPPMLEEWPYDLPPLVAFNSATGVQTSGSFVNAVQQNHPFEIFSQLSPATGGTDLGGAMEDILAACQRHINPALGGDPSQSCAAVIATDGEPETSGCVPTTVHQWHPSGVCVTESYSTHADRFFTAMDQYLAAGTGKNVIFILHMLPENFTGSSHMADFVTRVQARQPDGAMYINLNYATPNSFPQRLGFALGAILQVLETFTRFR